MDNRWETPDAFGEGPADRPAPPEPLEMVDVTYEPDRPVEPLRRRPRSRLRRRDRWAIGLFVATCISTFFSGMFAGVGAPRADWLREQPVEVLKALTLNGISYAGPLMLILLAHEMGHYLQARRYRVPATLPFFIPMPITPFGTMGAVIVQQAGVADRKALFDIAITGPLAGLLVALPVTYFALQDVQIVQLDPNAGGVEIRYGDPLVLQWMVEVVHRPLAENEDIILTPMLFAGWVGIFITALNLMPVGQLDGGHILYTLIGRKAHYVAYALILLAVAHMVHSKDYAYSLIIALLVLVGPRHPPTADDRVPLGMPRVLLGWLTLAFIIFGFTPRPITITVHEPPPPPVPVHSEEPQFMTRDNLDERSPEEEARGTEPDAADEGRCDGPSSRGHISLIPPARPYPSQRDFMKARAFLARCSSDGNMRRQIFVAAARSGRASPKASTISQPS